MGQYLVTVALLLAALACYTAGAARLAMTFGAAAVASESLFWIRVLIRRRSKHAPQAH